MNRIIAVWFTTIMLLAGLVCGYFEVGLHGLPFAGKVDAMLKWVTYLAVGWVGVWGFIGHGLMHKKVAKTIGWEASPFQWELACFSLGLGVAGIVASYYTRPFYIALTIVVAVFLWGTAIGHIREMILRKNFSINNCGPILWTDILIPATLIVLLVY